MNTEKLTWYVARSGGIIAWLLLALGLVLGLLLSSRVLGRRASPAWLLSIHRFLGGLSVIFTFVHVAAIMLDDFVAFGWSDVLVPWSSEWNPNAVAWGIIATYLAIAIELTSFAMRRLPKRLWRGVHWLSAPLFVLATVHGYQAGTDAGRAFIITIVAFCALLGALTIVRVATARAATEPRPTPELLIEQAKARHATAEAVTATPQRPTVAWTDLRSADLHPAERTATHQPVAGSVEGVDGTVPDPGWMPVPSVEQSPPTPSPREQPIPSAPTRAPSSERPFWEPDEVGPAIRPTPPTPPRPVAPVGPPARHAPIFEPDPPAAPWATPPVEERSTLEPAPAADEPSSSSAPDTPSMPNRRDHRELQTVGATRDLAPPEDAGIGPDEPAWFGSGAGTEATAQRRPGPVPGVWKRTRRTPPQGPSTN